VAGRIELLAGVELDAHVVDLDGAAGLRLRTVADGDVLDHEIGGRRAGLELDLGLGHDILLV
jgi:hypothetical protein